MSGNEGFDPEDLDRLVRGMGEQLRGVLGRVGRTFDASGDAGPWSGVFNQGNTRPRPAPEPATTGETGDGVWVIYTSNSDGVARVEEVFATELDALRANKHNTDGNRHTRFLPYGMAVSVLDATEKHQDG